MDKQSGCMQENEVIKVGKSRRWSSRLGGLGNEASLRTSHECNAIFAVQSLNARRVLDEMNLVAVIDLPGRGFQLGKAQYWESCMS